jgi:hypothetical protein
MAKIIPNFITPDGVLHEDFCLITSKLVIEHGINVEYRIAEKNSPPQKERIFKFQAEVQSFHSKEIAEEGGKALTDGSLRVIVQDANTYFQKGGASLFDLGFGKTQSEVIQNYLKTIKFLDVIDAGVWNVISDKHANILTNSKEAVLGDCMFTNPAASRKVNW